MIRLAMAWPGKSGLYEKPFYLTKSTTLKAKTFLDEKESATISKGYVFVDKEIEFGGIIDKDTVWNANLVKVTDSIIINNGATLTILPGTKVEFQEFIHKEVLNQMAAEQRKTMLTNLDLLKASMEAVKELMA